MQHGLLSKEHGRFDSGRLNLQAHVTSAVSRNNLSHHYVFNSIKDPCGYVLDEGREIIFGSFTLFALYSKVPDESGIIIKTGGEKLAKKSVTLSKTYGKRTSWMESLTYSRKEKD